MTLGLKLQAIAISTLMSTALPAMAGGFGFSFGYSGGHRHRHGVNVGVVIGRPAVVAAPVVVAPAPVVVPVVPVHPVYVPPVYGTVTERVWVPTVQTAYRDVPVYDVYGRVVSYRREPYTISSGYWSQVPRRVVVREGYWTSAPGPGPVVAPAPIRPDRAAPGEDDGNVDYDGGYTRTEGTRASFIR